MSTLTTFTSNAPSKPLDLSVVLQGLDTVDRERTREAILNEAINVGATKEALSTRLKAHYAAQGITDVSDEAVQRGVDQLYENRFAHRPIPKGFKRTLGVAWINRTIITAWLLICLLGGVLIGVGLSQIRAYTVRAEQRAVIERVEAEKARVAKVEADRVAAIAAEAKRVAAEKAAAEKRASDLKGMPDRLRALGVAITEVAKEQGVRDRADQLVATGIGLATAGDLQAAQRTYQDLTETLALLNLEYEARINLSGTKPGMSKPSNGSSPWVTGGFRVFNGSKRFYVVVNAVDPRTNAAVTVPVRNEETGQVSRVSFWAEQVSEHTFNQIRAEKGRTGALSNTLFASKGKGYMEPTYKQGLKAAFVEAGASHDPAAYRITRW